MGQADIHVNSPLAIKIHLIILVLEKDLSLQRIYLEMIMIISIIIEMQNDRTFSTVLVMKKNN